MKLSDKRIIRFKLSFWFILLCVLRHSENVCLHVIQSNEIKLYMNAINHTHTKGRVKRIPECRI